MGRLEGEKGRIEKSKVCVYYCEDVKHCLCSIFTPDHWQQKLKQSSMWQIDFLCNFQLTFEYMISQGHNKTSISYFSSPFFPNKLPLKSLLSIVSFCFEWFFKKNKAIMGNFKFDFLMWTQISTSILPHYMPLPCHKKKNICFVMVKSRPFTFP